MTREAYEPDRLDSLALRIFDIAARVRQLAQTARGEQMQTVELHDRKAQEWLDKLEQWLAGAEADVLRQAKLAASARKAQEYR